MLFNISTKADMEFNLIFTFITEKIVIACL